MALKNWTKLYQEYKGQWVALSDDETGVIATGESRRDTEVRAAQAGHPDAVVLRMPEKLEAFAG